MNNSPHFGKFSKTSRKFTGKFLDFDGPYDHAIRYASNESLAMTHWLVDISSEMFFLGHVWSERTNRIELIDVPEWRPKPRGQETTKLMKYHEILYHVVDWKTSQNSFSTWMTIWVSASLFSEDTAQEAYTELASHREKSQSVEIDSRRVTSIWFNFTCITWTFWYSRWKCWHGVFFVNIQTEPKSWQISMLSRFCQQPQKSWKHIAMVKILKVTRLVTGHNHVVNHKAIIVNSSDLTVIKLSEPDVGWSQSMIKRDG